MMSEVPHHTTIMVPVRDEEVRGPIRPALPALPPGALRIAGLVLLGAGLAGAVGWSSFRFVRSGAAASAYATLAGGITTRLGDGGPPGEAPTVAVTADTSADLIGDVVGVLVGDFRGDSAAHAVAKRRAAAGRSATGGSATGDSLRTDTGTQALALVDSAAPVEPPHPATLVGTWYHGDSRSKYGDSLTLELEPDGTAAGHERRYGLNRDGWSATRTNREGRWYVRYRGRRSPQLCTEWVKPTELNACATMVVVDSVTTGAIMQFAGRHWRQERTDAAVTSVAESPRRSRKRGSVSGSG